MKLKLLYDVVLLPVECKDDHPAKRLLDKAFKLVERERYQKAIEPFKQADKLFGGNAHCSYNLGQIYHALPLPQSPVQTLYWYVQSAKLGCVDALYQLGCYFSDYPLGLRVDHEAAFWFEAAANSGHAAAQYQLAYCYATGRGVNRDSRQACYWLHQAHERGGVEVPLELEEAFLTACANRMNETE